MKTAQLFERFKCVDWAQDDSIEIDNIRYVLSQLYNGYLQVLSPHYFLNEYWHSDIN